MSVDPVAALKAGFDRLTTVSGVVVGLLFVLVGLVELPVRQTLSVHIWDYLLTIDQVRTAIRQQYGELVVPGNPLALEIGIEATLGALAVIFVLVAAFRLVGIRAFATTATKSFPGVDVRAGFWSAFAAILGFEILLLAITGFLLLAPGAAGWFGGQRVAILVFPAYLLVAVALLAITVLLYFARQVIALENAGPIAGIRESYRLCRSNVAPIFVLLVALFGVSIIGSLGLGVLLPNGYASPIVSTIYQRIAAVYGIAVSTQAYLQMK